MGQIRRNDIILIVFLLAAAGIFALVLHLTKQEGAVVLVSTDGRETMRLSLHEDTELLLGSGDKTNRLVIRDGQAWISDASCPDRICVNQGKIRYAGQSVVCLPHSLVISIEGGTDAGYDAQTH